MAPSDSDAIFSALADPTRRAILSLIGEHEELTAGEIAAHFDSLGRTAVSSQSANSPPRGTGGGAPRRPVPALLGHLNPGRRKWWPS